MLPLFRLSRYIVDVIKVNINPHSKIAIYTNHYAINGHYEGYRKISPRHMYKVDLPTRYKHWNNLILVLIVHIREKVISVSSSDINVRFERLENNVGPIKYQSFYKPGYFSDRDLKKNRIRQTFSRFIYTDYYKYQCSVNYCNNIHCKTYFVKHRSLKKGSPNENSITEIVVNYNANGQMKKIKIYDYNNPHRIYKLY
jgi:hypothetical protein